MNNKLLTLTAGFLLMLGACSQKPASNVDTPEYHFSAGMRLVEQGQYADAIKSFDRAVALKKKFAPGYGGLAIAYGSLGETGKAVQYIDAALERGGKNADVLVLCGRAWISLRDQKGNWFKKAEAVLNKALKRKKNHEGALYYLGVANLYAYEFATAESYFSRVVEKRGEYAGRADAKWKLSQKIVRAMPGTPVGKKVALQDNITRADLAVLFVEELKIGELMSKMPQKNQGFQTPQQLALQKASLKPTDIAGHWAKAWIDEAVQYQVMDLYSDGKFYPNEIINRAGYAMAVQRLLVVATRDFGLETRYFGEKPSRFSDVPSSHPAYNAMALCSERGIMEADVLTGQFKPAENVGGADALLIIKTLQGRLRQTF